MELVKKNIVLNQPKAQDLNSYFLANVKKHSKKINSTIENENIIANSNKSFDINKSSCKQ